MLSQHRKLCLNRVEALIFMNGLQLAHSCPPHKAKYLKGRYGEILYQKFVYIFLYVYSKSWLLSVCAYNTGQQENERLGLRDTVRGCGFPLTSTCSSSCTVGLPELKIMQYEASDIGKHCKNREIHNLRGRVPTKAATTQFFSSEI